MRGCRPSIMRVALLALAALGAVPLVAQTATAQTARDCACRMTPDGRCIRNPDCPRPHWRRAFRHDQGGFSGGNQNGAPRPAASAKAAPRPNFAPAARAPASATVAAPASLTIQDTGYSYLTAIGKEEPGYGLYSYAILPSASPRGNALLAEIFKQVDDVNSLPAKRNALNILYLPMQGDKQVQFTVLQKAAGQTREKLSAAYASSYYSYTTAKALLYHLCSPPHQSVADICQGDMSRGPYLFTYASPASQMESVPPPFLFVDLSDVHEKAFGEMLSAFKEQVKSDNVSDRARIDTFRLRLLSIVLTASGWVSPVQKAMADIVRVGSDDKKDDKK